MRQIPSFHHPFVYLLLLSFSLPCLCQVPAFVLAQPDGLIVYNSTKSYYNYYLRTGFPYRLVINPQQTLLLQMNQQFTANLYNNQEYMMVTGYAESQPSTTSGNHIGLLFVYSACKHNSWSKQFNLTLALRLGQSYTEVSIPAITYSYQSPLLQYLLIRLIMSVFVAAWGSINLFHKASSCCRLFLGLLILLYIYMNSLGVRGQEIVVFSLSLSILQLMVHSGWLDFQMGIITCFFLMLLYLLGYYCKDFVKADQSQLYTNQTVIFPMLLKSLQLISTFFVASECAFSIRLPYATKLKVPLFYIIAISLYQSLLAPLLPPLFSLQLFHTYKEEKRLFSFMPLLLFMPISNGVRDHFLGMWIFFLIAYMLDERLIGLGAGLWLLIEWGNKKFGQIQYKKKKRILLQMQKKINQEKKKQGQGQEQEQGQEQGKEQEKKTWNRLQQASSDLLYPIYHSHTPKQSQQQSQHPDLLQHLYALPVQHCPYLAHLLPCCQVPVPEHPLHPRRRHLRRPKLAPPSLHSLVLLFVAFPGVDDELAYFYQLFVAMPCVNS